MENSKTLVNAPSQVSPETQTLMKVAVISSPRIIEYRNIPFPQISNKEVLIKLEGCGVCGSDLPVWEGRPWFSYPAQPGAPGHEGFGTIDALGNEVATLKIGDRVAMLSYHAYAEYDIALEDQVVKLPESVSKMPFPGEPLGCAINVFRRSAVRKDDIVAVVGAGFIGNLLIQLCKAEGAKVIAISRRESSLNMAFESGADYIIKMDDHYQILQKVNEITENKGCNVVIEATGKQWPLDIAGDITTTRGRLIIAGYHQDGLRQVNVQNWNWKGLDVINAHERDPQEYIKGMQLAVEAVKNGLINPQPLFTHQYTFDELNIAFHHMASGEGNYLKGIIRFDLFNS